MYYLDLFPSGDFAEEIVYISFFLLFWNETHAIRNIYTYLAPHPCILILTSSRTLVNMNSAEDSPHITMQCITTFECSLAGVSVLQHSQSQRQRKGCKSWQFKLSSVSSASPNTGTYKWSRNNGAISPWLCIHVSNRNEHVATQRRGISPFSHLRTKEVNGNDFVSYLKFKASQPQSQRSFHKKKFIKPQAKSLIHYPWHTSHFSARGLEQMKLNEPRQKKKKKKPDWQVLEYMHSNF